MAKKRPAKQDFEALTVILSVALVIAISSLVSNLMTSLSIGGPGFLSSSGQASGKVSGYSMPAHLRSKPIATGQLNGSKQAFQEPKTEGEKKVAERFQQAIGLLHARRYDYAITALDSVLQLAPEMPEAYVNMGFAFIGLKEFGPARGAFEKAIELKMDQVNAYYGLAIALEGQGELETALGAMRSYIHLSQPDDPFLVKARAALWEWEAELGRVKGVKTAPEGQPGATVKTPSWDNSH